METRRTSPGELLTNNAAIHHGESQREVVALHASIFGLCGLIRLLLFRVPLLNRNLNVVAVARVSFARAHNA